MKPVRSADVTGNLLTYTSSGEVVQHSTISSDTAGALTASSLKIDSTPGDIDYINHATYNNVWRHTFGNANFNGNKQYSVSRVGRNATFRMGQVYIYGYSPARSQYYNAVPDLPTWCQPAPDATGLSGIMNDNVNKGYGLHFDPSSGRPYLWSIENAASPNLGSWYPGGGTGQNFRISGVGWTITN